MTSKRDRSGLVERRTDTSFRVARKAAILEPLLIAPAELPPLSAGYKMIKSFEAQNFRSFRALRLSGIPTVNILVGKSASGKTALLEALRMALGASPTVAWTLNGARGLLVPIPPNPTRDQFEAAWRSYFFDFDLTKTISFKIVDSEDRSASLEMQFDLERPVTPVTFMPSTAQPGIPTLTNTIIPLAFRRKTFAGEESTLDATVHQQQMGQLFLQQGPDLGTVSDFFPSAWQSNAQQVATWFSQLRISDQSGDIVAIINKQFPDILDLSSESPYGIASIYARVKYHSQMMPVALVSSGINKFISLLIAIRTHRGGVVLIDEVENGIYYQMFPALWNALHKFATANETQLFVSTHSLECLTGAATAMDEHPNDFSLIQVSHEKGESNASVAAGKNAAAALESGIEVRK